MSLKHIVSIVSGGASGLGAATVKQLLNNGARGIVVADLEQQYDSFLKLSTDVCATTTRDDSPNKPIIAFAPTDVTNENDVVAALDLAEEKFGQSVNVAVNCAGIATAKKTLSKSKTDNNSSTLKPHSMELFEKTLNVNVVGTFNVSRLAAERMYKLDPYDVDNKLRGIIINTSSIAAYDGQIGQVAYAASKGAVVSMTLPMARDLSKVGIRVMCVAPGLFHTPLLEGLPQQVQDDLASLIPLPSKLGNPINFGNLICNIISNPMLNGECIRLDGALRMPP